MIPGLNLYPLYQTTDACEIMACKWRSFRFDVCRREGCGFSWAREAAEHRARRNETDRAASTALNKGSHNLRSKGRT